MARNWNDMPNEVKFMIVDNMDIVTRTKLKMCSKSDKCIVESVPMHLKFVNCTPSVLDLGDIRIFEGKDDKIRKRIDGKSYPVKLPKKLQKYKTKYVFKKFLGNLLLHGNLRIYHFCTKLDFPSKLTHTTIDTKLASFNGKGEEIIKWIKVLSPKTKSIEIDGKGKDMLEGIGLIPLIINAERVYILRKNDITDEQLLTFKFTKGCIKKSKVTSKGAIQFVLHISSNDYPMDTDIEIYTIKDIGNPNAHPRDVDLDENLLETRLCLPMNSEKEVVYYYNPLEYRFSIYVQKAGGPVKTYREHHGMMTDDEMEEEESETDESDDEEDEMEEMSE